MSYDVHHTFDSSVGRAVDCSCTLSDIHRSLVQIRLEGVFVIFSQEEACGVLLTDTFMASNPECYSKLQGARVAQSVER